MRTVPRLRKGLGVRKAGGIKGSRSAKPAQPKGVRSQTAREQLRDEPQAAKIILEDMRHQSQSAGKRSVKARAALDKNYRLF